ncbi:penicillin acylase family protein [Anditalea andensis]|uniref:Peptidase S45 n=1 Tax=Anditalea andensis TaxID=1048983 RepID=A0A074LEV6_9BACT|nr:penicillin acylase family protein [Anditalea andensis]KEO72327.1 peptidase S45 [Anditalea andensis]
MVHIASAQDVIEALHEEVEVMRDEWGINHIFAKNEHDLFFTQGYLAAKDRLFQFEIWRRQATGTLAEILGDRELDRDIGVRLFKFRGTKERELTHYHPNGVEIVDAFVEGINAYIEEVRNKPENLPIEFHLLNILPEPWTWEVVISRHQGLLENVKLELDYTRSIYLLGEEKAKEIFYFHPFEPDLTIDECISRELIFKDIIAPYEAFRSPLIFRPEDIIPSAQREQHAYQAASTEEMAILKDFLNYERFAIGSNNWVISGELSQSGYPMMANDPHRRHAVPSLRYWAHLNAPGWNVIGAGEPVIPGISIGHNEYGAWGLTIFETDSEDLRIYDINPQNPYQYRYMEEWVDMKVINDTVYVKGQVDPLLIDHYYTHHGPVTFIDRELNKAVAIQAAWLEVGGAPYLASLRMGQAEDWEGFREACAYNHIPAENMVWADHEGNIGWQATGIAPIRAGFSGLVALPGDGSKEWGGFLPILDRPHEVNPSIGYIATANENVTDITYAYPNTLGFEWADAFRGDRIREVLSSGKKFTLEDMAALQNDYLSIPARQLTPYLANLNFENLKVLSAQESLKDWDHVLDKNSVAAAIYVMWERIVRAKVFALTVPEEARPYVGSAQMTRVLQWIEEDRIFGEEGRDGVLKESFEDAIVALEEKLGPEMKDWRYGQEAYKKAHIRHPLSAAVSSAYHDKLDVGPVARGGYSFTPSANAYGDNNTTGASFRIIVDTADWESTMGINTPGQSGDPESEFYKNLFEKWADDDYFKVSFDKQAVEDKAIIKVKYRPQ